MIFLSRYICIPRPAHLVLLPPGGGAVDMQLGFIYNAVPSTGQMTYFHAGHRRNTAPGRWARKSATDCFIAYASKTDEWTVRVV